MIEIERVDLIPVVTEGGPCSFTLGMTIPGPTPLTWKPVKVDGVWTAKMVCSNGHEAVLDRKIDMNGKVRPSVVCPADGCDFYEYVVLKDW